MTSFEESPTDPAIERSQASPKRVAGRYMVDRLVARGGMAAVYLAEHVDLKRPVALKILKPPDDAEGAEDFEERFRLEAQTLAQLSHSNIVTLHDFGEMEDGRFFLAMEFVEGPRFADLLREGPMLPERAIGLLLQVCQALRYAHGRGVIHRDLKPSNLLVRQYGDGNEVVKVVDFGLVKLTNDDQSMTKAGLVLGSPHCMSPEQVKGLDVDARTDIYAIGILLFRSILGKYPFHGRNSTATMMMHLNDPPPTFFSINPEITVPEGLEEVVRCCLEKDPQDRYPDMDALITALADVIDAPADAWLTSSVAMSTIRRQAPALSDGPSTSAIVLALSGGFAGAIAVMGLAWWLLDGAQIQAAPGASPAAPTEQAPTPEEAMSGQPQDEVDGAPAGEAHAEPEQATHPAPPSDRREDRQEDRQEPVEQKPATPKRAAPARSAPTRRPAPKPSPKPAEKADPKPQADPTPSGPEGYQGLPDDF